MTEPLHDSLACEACCLHESTIRNLTGDATFERKWQQAFKAWQKHCPAWIARLGKNLGGRPHHKGLHAGTLTQQPDAETTEDDMVIAMKKIFSQKTCPVKRYAWYVEYTQNGTPHIHFIYEAESGGRIHAKVFMRYWKLWNEARRQGSGFQGGFHKEVASEVAYLEYISKDSGRSENKWDDIV